MQTKINRIYIIHVVSTTARDKDLLKLLLKQPEIDGNNKKAIIKRKL